MKRAWVVVLASGMMMGSGCFLIPPFLLGDPELRPFTSAAEMAAFVNAERQRQSRSFGGGLFPEPLFALGGAAPPLATDADSFDGSSAGDDAGVTDTTSESGDFSTTTVQEVGVDEGDLVKNDASYIYVLKGSQVRIVKAQPAAELSQASSVDLPGSGVALYLRDDQLIAITSNGGGFFIDDFVIFGDVIDEPAVLEADAAQDADVITISPEEPQVRITVIDVTDRTAPSVTRTVTIEGSLVNSRMIDNRLHLILQKFPSFSVETLTEDDVTELLPRFVVTGSDGEDDSGFVVEPTDVLHPLDPSGVTLTTVSTVNVDTGEIQAISVIGGAETLYASTGALYLATSTFSDGFSLIDGASDESTDIHKIALTDDGPSYVGSGKVPGRPLDQYSFSEFNGDLRVATTSNAFTFDGVSSNNVYVLRENALNGSLSIVGQLEGIAPGERIFSARFVGDKGFLVTFVQIDPLFTIDLSDPTNPVVVGELKVPGFSTFILPISETELLTIGRDATEEGFPLGVQLSLFDVSDFANPTLTDKVTLGLNGSWSEALNNPKALTWLPSRRLVAIPVTLVEAGGEDFLGGLSFSGLIVHHVSADGLFTERGRISTQPPTVNEFDFFSTVAFTRGVFLDDDVFAVTPDRVRGAAVSNVNGATISLELE